MAAIRLGVIGTGLIWIRAHQAILATMREVFEPVAFCDPDAQRRSAVAAAFPQARVVASYEQLLALPEVEMVLVLTPIALNAPVALAALRAGKDVIMEKPIARSVAEGQALVTLARASGRRLFVAEQLAYRAGEEVLAQLVGSGAIGELVVWNRVEHVEGDTAQGSLRYDSTPWRKTADYPLGTLFDGGIHLIASLSKTFGVPESVFATGRKLRPEYGEYDQVSIQFQYRNGTVGQLSYASCLPPVQNHFQLYGIGGAISVEPGQFIVKTADGNQRSVERPQEQSYWLMWRAFVQAIHAQREPYYTPERALHDVAILEAVARSIKSGQREAVMQ